MNVTVIGLGYVGLPTAALAAGAGNTVFGYDTNERLRHALRNGAAGGREPDVVAAVKRALGDGSLRICDSVEPADIYVVCVPTPTHGSRPDLSYVESALGAVAAVIRPDDVIIVESTVPPGTTERAAHKALAAAGKPFAGARIVHAPERILPGDILRELRENDRIIGGRRPQDAEVAARFYAGFVTGKLHLTDVRTAEFVKVIENTYRDVNIALANELALFCEENDLDVWRAVALANNHPRVNIMQPGPGVGGHCIPIDPRFLADQNPFATELIQASRRVNERMPALIVRRVEALIGEGDGRRKVAVLGAAYKANVDDIRESPALRICEMLADRGYRVAVYDPIAEVPDGEASLEAAVVQSDAIVLAVDHDALRDADPFALAPLVRTPVLIDCRNFYPSEDWSAAGFRVYALGRGNQFQARAPVTRAKAGLA